MGGAVELKPRHTLARGEKSVLLPWHVSGFHLPDLDSSLFPLEDITFLHSLPVDGRLRIHSHTRQILMDSLACAI